MEMYKKVEVKEYVENGLKNGIMVPIQAEKFARIIARQGNVGDIVITWSVDDKGNPIIEKRTEVTVDEVTGEPNWIATKTDETGNPIVDLNGNLNQWVIEDSKFKKKYEIDSSLPGIFKPTGGVQTFVEIPENITLTQWGEDMNIAAGGYINITDPNDLYGISKRDFEDTYKKLVNSKTK